MKLGAPLILATAVLLVGAAAPPEGAGISGALLEPSIAEIAGKYRSFQRMTQQEVVVDRQLAMLCVTVTLGQVQAARAAQGPHANAAILIYMNEIAARDFLNGKSVYSLGAVVVKQKSILGYTDPLTGTRVRGADHGVGGMVKRPAGFDSAHGDWEYFYFEDAAKIESGRISSCVKCHDGAKSTDHVFGTWAKVDADSGSRAPGAVNLGH